MNPLFWFFTVTALVWMYRSRLALKTLDTAPVVRPSPALEEQNELVSVIIPAKNEEKNIEFCVNSLLNQDYAKFEIIVINDNSTDRTETILRNLGAEAPSLRGRMKYMNAPETPPGWTGKNFAIHTGVAEARGNWLLFTDADTRHEPSSIRASMQHVLSRDIAFLTLLPRCLVKSFWEYLIQPCAMALIGLWFPLERVNHPRSSVYFANGQYLLIQKNLYRKLGGHESVKEAYLEDFALMKKSKQSGSHTQCAFGMDVYGTRMYDSFAGIWKGWRRIFLHAFERKPAPLVGKTISLVAFSVLPYLFLIPLTRLALTLPEQYGFLWGASLVLLIFILGTAWKAYSIVRAKRLFALLYPLAAFIVSIILLDATWMALTKKATTWR
ncbi:MAG: glycosyltransferase [Candidatus Omnitrophota bacterium]|nr:glycosyltransferase [Candidatus Omnitrophota bacterium]